MAYGALKLQSAPSSGWNETQWRDLLERVEELYGHVSLRRLATASVELVKTAVPCDQIVYCVTDNPGGRAAAVFWPKGTDLPSFMPAYEANWTQNPVGNRFVVTGHCDPRPMSQIMPRHQLEKLDLFNDFMRPAHVHAFMTAYMPLTDGYRLAVTAIRESRDFDSLEADRFETVRRHLVRSFRTLLHTCRLLGQRPNANELLEEDTLTPGVVIKNDHYKPGVSGFGVPAQRKLSPREAEVLHWMIYGKTNAEIGIILGCSSRTVGKHVEHILAKLGVASRTAASVEAMRLGMHVPTSPPR